MIIAFESDTTVHTASRLKSALLKILREPVEHYKFDLADVIDTDITFIQLLIAFNISLKREERKMTIINCTDTSPFMNVCKLCGIDIRSIMEFEG